MFCGFPCGQPPAPSTTDIPLAGQSGAGQSGASQSGQPSTSQQVVSTPIPLRPPLASRHCCNCCCPPPVIVQPIVITAPLVSTGEGDPPPYSEEAPHGPFSSAPPSAPASAEGVFGGEQGTSGKKAGQGTPPLPKKVSPEAYQAPPPYAACPPASPSAPPQSPEPMPGEGASAVSLTAKLPPTSEIKELVACVTKLLSILGSHKSPTAKLKALAHSPNDIKTVYLFVQFGGYGDQDLKDIHSGQRSPQWVYPEYWWQNAANFQRNYGHSIYTPSQLNAHHRDCDDWQQWLGHIRQYLQTKYDIQVPVAGVGPLSTSSYGTGAQGGVSRPLLSRTPSQESLGHYETD